MVFQYVLNVVPSFNCTLSLGLAPSKAVLISRWSAAALMNLSLIVFSLGNMFACIEMILSSDIQCWSIQQLPFSFCDIAHKDR